MKAGCPLLLRLVLKMDYLYRRLEHRGFSNTHLDKLLPFACWADYILLSSHFEEKSSRLSCITIGVGMWEFAAGTSLAPEPHGCSAICLWEKRCFPLSTWPWFRSYHPFWHLLWKCLFKMFLFPSESDSGCSFLLHLPPCKALMENRWLILD